MNRRVKRSLIILISAVVSVLAVLCCDEPARLVDTSVSVSLRATEVENEAGSTFISVKTEGAWTLHLIFDEGQKAWAKLSAISGKGEHNGVILSYEANSNESPRSVTIEARCEQNISSVNLMQAAADPRPERPEDPEDPEPSDPVDPEQPEDPEDPETPDPEDPSPEDPEEPSDPSEPEEPDTPDQPENPSEPDDPGQPDEPETPDPEDPSPEDPEEPSDPSEPEEPNIPDQPENPSEPDDPGQPDDPETPEPENPSPEDPEEPSDPSEPEEPDTPDQPENPSEPEDPSQPDEPETPEPEDSETVSPAVDESWLELPSGMDGDSYLVNTLYASGERNYTHLYDPETYVSLWTAYPLKSSHMGSNSRPGSWTYNPLIDSDLQADLCNGSYSGGTYSRGHMIPNGSRNGNKAMQLQTFHVTNSVPQRQDRFNGSIWANLENAVQSVAQGEEIYVITGVTFNKVGENKSVSYVSPNKNSSQKCAIPNYFFKAVLKVNKSGSTVTSASTIGFWFEHKDYEKGDNYENYSVSVDQLEKWLGYDLFVNLPDSVEDAAETNSSWSSFRNF